MGVGTDDAHGEAHLPRIGRLQGDHGILRQFLLGVAGLRGVGGGWWERLAEFGEDLPGEGGRERRRRRDLRHGPGVPEAGFKRLLLV